MPCRQLSWYEIRHPHFKTGPKYHPLSYREASQDWMRREEMDVRGRRARMDLFPA